MAATGKHSGSIIISPLNSYFSPHYNNHFYTRLFSVGQQDRPKVLCLYLYVYDPRQDCVATTQATEAEEQSEGWISVDVISFLNVTH